MTKRIIRRSEPIGGSGTKARRIKKPHSNRVRGFMVGEGLPDLTAIRAELQDYVDCLLGRVDPPIDVGVGTLAEIAAAYYARAREIEMILLRKELDGHVIKGSAHYKFRCGELRSFIELSKNSWELGSRRISMEQLAMDQGA